MEVCRRSSWLLLLLGVSLLATTLQGVQGEAESEGPSESECRPYIEKALKELETGEGTLRTETGDSKEDSSTIDVTTDDSDHQEGEGDDDTHEVGTESIESVEADQNVPPEQETHEETTDDTQETETEGASQEQPEASKEDQNTEEVAGTSGETEEVAEEGAETQQDEAEDTKEDNKEETDETVEETDTTVDDTTKEETDDATKEETDDATKEETDDATKEETDDATKEETDDATKEETDDTREEADDTKEETDDTKEEADDTKEEGDETKEETDDTKEDINETKEDDTKEAEEIKEDTTQEETDTNEETEDTKEEVEHTREERSAEEEAQADEPQETDETKEEQDTPSVETVESKEEEGRESVEDNETKEGTTEDEGSKEDTKSEVTEDDKSASKEETKEGDSGEPETTRDINEKSAEQDDSTPDDAKQEESKEDQTAEASKGESAEATEGAESVETQEDESKSREEGESAPEEELSIDIEIPSDLRDRTHVEHLLKLDDEASGTEDIINRVAEVTLRELKKLYENAIKPLEVLYKYRDLSNRHFGDAEIFSKPLILFMGPWSGGKSSIINYLLDNEYNETSLRTGAEPSPAYFNILMYGEEPEILDGTQLAADFTFSGLQKFGQGLEERLRGVKLPNKLLEKVNIVEIPGILEVRKQVSRVFPFNDACQWFIDRADIIFLVYDPSKLDVGPETEAILDQLKGREHQTRIVLNKADQVKPEELLRVQGALIWNISPLMSSAQPPIMYTTSLWSRPYETWAPMRLLQAQERAFLRDLRSAIEKRIENKIASARRFAVRVRNHAKMVDCYLTTYYNHKSVFGNRKQVADAIIEHPQDYHIYEGLSTLTNISRYDLPDPEVYRDFFKLNPLYDFQQLSATCTYFRGCPINRLDIAIAYDLPEMVGKHKRLVESALAEANETSVPGS